jgi:hypothetical protein
MNMLTRILVVTIAAAIFLAPVSTAQEDPATAAKIMFDAANRERFSRGLPRLQWDDNLASAALAHAQRMARENSIGHQFSGEPPLLTRVARTGAHFSELAENVAVGPDAVVIHSEWMHSPPHRANLLAANMNSLGIGVAERDGQLFAVEDFSDAVAALSLEGQERQTGARLEELGLRLTGNTQDARRDCSMPRGFTGNPAPRFKVRYTTTDPSQLPQALEDKIRSGHYRAVAVGACPSSDRTGFTGYRLSVFLY